MWTMEPPADPTVTTTTTTSSSSSVPPTGTTTETTTTSGSSPPGTVSFHDAAWVGGTLLAVLLVVGLILALAQNARERRRHDQTGSVVRSWLAMSLVLGLLTFCLLAFLVPDTNIRTTLLGGLIASAGAATAFYFSARSGEQARKDLMQAQQNVAVTTETVPDLKGMTQIEASARLGRTSLKLEIDPAKAPQDQTSKVTDQQPPKDSMMPAGSSIMVSF